MAKACRGQGGGAAQRAGEAAPDGTYTPPLPEEIRVNPIRSQADWQAMREACENDPG